MDTNLQRRRLREHLAYYQQVFPQRDAAYQRFKSTTIIPRIYRALHKIDAGTYGICDDCGDAIAESRLAVVPGALRCVACQKSSEGTS